MAPKTVPAIFVSAASWCATSLCAVFLLSSCDPVLDSVPAKKIVIAAAGSATSIQGEAGTLQMSVLDVEPASSNSEIKWFVTFGTGMASISSSGLVTAQVGGTVEVFASDGAAKSNKIPIMKKDFL